MKRAQGYVTGVAPRSGPDGSHKIEVTTTEGQMIDVVIPRPHTVYLLKVIQEAAIRRAVESANDVSVPMLRVSGIQPAPAGSAKGVMVSTAEIGSVVLLMTEEQLKLLRSDGGELSRPAQP